MKILCVGDIHGNTFDLKRAVKHAYDQGCERVFFLGDFGWWHDNSKLLAAAESAFANTGLITEWIDGNHENFDDLYSHEIGDGGYRWLSPFVRHIPRGSIETINGKKFLFMGGAISIDRWERKPGKSYWPQEAISDADIIHAANMMNYVGGSVDVVLAHDGPLMPRGTNKNSDGYWPSEWKLDLALSDLNREKLKIVADYAKAKLWVHGHHHTRWTGEYEFDEYETTRVECLDKDGGKLVDCTYIIDTEEL